MSSIFTSIGKVLTIKFLLIFLSIIFYIDIYFYLTYDVIFVEKYKDYLNIKDILIVTLFYLVTLNVIIPLVAFVFSFFGSICFANIIENIFLYLSFKSTLSTSFNGMNIKSSSNLQIPLFSSSVTIFLRASTLNVVIWQLKIGMLLL